MDKMKRYEIRRLLIVAATGDGIVGGTGISPLIDGDGATSELAENVSLPRTSPDG